MKTKRTRPLGAGGSAPKTDARQAVPRPQPSPDRERWLTPPRRGFLFPTTALSKVFRGKYLDLLTEAHRAGELRMPGDGDPDDTRAFDCLKASLQSNDWVVYTKAPFAGAANVLAYLGRYTHLSERSDKCVYGDQVFMGTVNLNRLS